MPNQAHRDTKSNPGTLQNASGMSDAFMSDFKKIAPGTFENIEELAMFHIVQNMPAIIQTLIDQDAALKESLSAVLGSSDSSTEKMNSNDDSNASAQSTLEQKVERETNDNPLQLIAEYAGLPRLEQKIHGALDALKWIESEGRTPALTLTQLQLLLGVVPAELNLSEAIPGDNWQCTPLHYLAVAGRLNSTHLSIGSPNLGMKNRFDETPHHWAARNGNIESVRALADAYVATGADLNIKNGNGDTALICATKNGHIEIVLALIAAGADLNIKNKDGRTALICAAINGDIEIVLALAKAYVATRADLNIKTNLGNTALICAAIKGHPEIVRALAEAYVATGADLNIKNNNGDTALIWAAYKGHIEIVCALIAAGADLNIKDNEGRTALDEARCRYKTAAVKAIIEADTILNGAVHSSDSKVISDEDLGVAQQAHVKRYNLMATKNWVHPALDHHLIPDLANIVVQYCAARDFHGESVRPRALIFTAKSILYTHALQRQQILDPQTSAQRVLLQDIHKHHLMISPALLAFLSEALGSADPAAFGAQDVARIDFLMKALDYLNVDEEQRYYLDQIMEHAGAWFSQTMDGVIEKKATTGISALITPGASREELQQAADQIKHECKDIAAAQEPCALFLKALGLVIARKREQVLARQAPLQIISSRPGHSPETQAEILETREQFSRRPLLNFPFSAGAPAPSDRKEAPRQSMQ